MIKSCVIGLSKVGIIHCKSLIKIKKTSLNYIFDKNYKLSKRLYKKFKCNTSINFDSIFKKKDIIRAFLYVLVSPSACNKEFIATTIIKRKDPQKIILVQSKPKFITSSVEPIILKTSSDKLRPISVIKNIKITEKKINWQK